MSKAKIVNHEDKIIATVQAHTEPPEGNALLVQSAGVVVNPDGSTAVRIVDADGQEMQFNTRGHQEVEIASQISPPVMVHAHKLNGVTTLTADAGLNDKVFAVTVTTGAVVGDALTLTNPVTNIYYNAHITDITGLNITVDVPLDQIYPAADAVVSFISHDMNVDGSVTPVEFGLRSAEIANVDITVDITRIIWSAITATAVKLNLFGDLAPLPNGLALRKRLSDGTYQNILNVHDNLDFISYAYDFSVTSSANPAQAVNGFACRLTFGGESKLGTVVRVAPDEDLEFYVQDDLTDLVDFKVMFMGAQVAE
jgi:hypothetical protein